MKKITVISLIATVLLSATSLFGQGDFLRTDRLGYTTTIVRYDTLADLQAGVNAVDTINLGDRDFSINYWEDTRLFARAAWFYTTDPSGQQGVGNTRGNNGPGFMQMYDDDYSTVNSARLYFDGFDGTNWTEARFRATGTNAIYPDEVARWSVYNNDNDEGIFHSYSLDLTLTGLQGQQVSPDQIVANNHPTGVSGKMTSVFEITSTDTGPQDLGFYAVEMTFNMNSWAWDNRDQLTYPANGFRDTFVVAPPVPEPAEIGMLSLIGLGALLLVRRRFKK